MGWDSARRLLRGCLGEPDLVIMALPLPTRPLVMDRVGLDVGLAFQRPAAGVFEIIIIK